MKKGVSSLLTWAGPSFLRLSLSNRLWRACLLCAEHWTCVLTWFCTIFLSGEVTVELQKSLVVLFLSVAICSVRDAVRHSNQIQREATLCCCLFFLTLNGGEIQGPLTKWEHCWSMAGLNSTCFAVRPAQHPINNLLITGYTLIFVAPSVACFILTGFLAEGKTVKAVTWRPGLHYSFHFSRLFYNLSSGGGSMANKSLSRRGRAVQLDQEVSWSARTKVQMAGGDESPRSVQWMS